jgi:hypothetical protein
VSVLAAILDAHPELPAITWTLSCTGGLAGQVNGIGIPPEEARATFTTWRQALRLDNVKEAPIRDTGVTCPATATTAPSASDSSPTSTTRSPTKQQARQRRQARRPSRAPASIRRTGAGMQQTIAQALPSHDPVVFSPDRSSRPGNRRGRSLRRPVKGTA